MVLGIELRRASDSIVDGLKGLSQGWDQGWEAFAVAAATVVAITFIARLADPLQFLQDLFAAVGAAWRAFWTYVWSGQDSHAPLRPVVTASLYLAAPLALVGVSNSGRELEVQHPQPQLEMNESEIKYEFGKVYRSSKLTLVQASVHAIGEEEDVDPDEHHGVVCGYVWTGNPEMKTKRAYAAMHYGFETNNPVSTLSMLVKKGESWKVDLCEQDPPEDSMRERMIKALKKRPVKAYELTVSIEKPDPAPERARGTG